MAVIAHRGASGLAPENTLAAVKMALKLKVDIIEIDVHQTRDSVVVVLHDYSVDHRTNGKGKVVDLTLEEIRQYDAGKWFGEAFRNEKIPTLSEVLSTVDGRCRLIVEIKGDDKLYPGLTRRVLKMIEGRNAASWCMIGSFEDSVLDTVKALAPSVKIHKILVGKLPFLPFLIDTGIRKASLEDYRDIQAVNPFYLLVSNGLIDDLHRQGLEVNVWTVDKPLDMRRLIKAGVDGIITNRPDILIDVLKDMGLYGF